MRQIVNQPRHRVIQLAGAGLLALLLAACSSSTAEEAKESGNRVEAASREVPVNVSIERVSPTSFQSSMSVVGEVDSEHNATLSAQASGALVRVIHDRGAQVAKGDTLLEIDSRRARAAWEMAAASHDNTRLDFETVKRQHEQGLGVSATDFRKAENALRMAKAQLAEAAVGLENCFVIAPFSGLVDERYAKLGELVTPGMPLLRLVDNEHLKVVCGVPENLAGFLEVGKRADVHVREADLHAEGVVRWVAAAVNTRDRTIQTELSLSDGAGELKPGMVCEVVIKRRSHENAIVVPLTVIQQSDHKDYVYVVENDRAVKRSVTSAERDGTRVRLSSGLNAGDNLVVKGFRSVVDGQAVKIVKGSAE